MPVTRAKKVTILDVLTNNVATQKSVLFLTTKNSQVSVDAVTNQKFRMAARSKGLMIQVVKNSLLNRIFPSLPKLSGQTYLAYMFDPSQSDEVSVAKNILDLVAKDFKLHFDVIGSVVVGNFYEKARTLELAKTPTKDQSMAMVAGAINNLIVKIAIGIKEIPASLARGVSEYSKKLS